MTDVLPQSRDKVHTPSQDVTTSFRANRSSLKEASTRKGDQRAASPDNAKVLSVPTGKSYQSRLVPSMAGNQPSNGSKSVNGEERRDLQAIDPLSHHIMKRTNTQSILPPKLHTGAPPEERPGGAEVGASIASARTSSDPVGGRNENTIPSTKDKRNRSSFFSRFAPRKKDTLPEVKDNASEAGDRRTEGMDADAFSQPIGYIPRFPSPPKYIKVRSHGKKGKDFNRLFLAQELKGRTGVEIAQSGGRLVKNSAYKHEDKDGNAIWAMEFSKDGKHLAAGGKDYIVRVWRVIATKEERLAQETEAESSGRGSEGVRLSAPVFQPKTVQEFGGHTASILGLDWSKNNFLLSSSMDKSVRLWHLSRDECLCCFRHADIVTAVKFHPRDDRFFLAGSLDSKLRLWSIPDKSVAYFVQTPDLITAVAFAPDGKTAIAGCLNGLCLFYETEGLKYNTQIHVRSAYGKNAKGSKVTGIQAIEYPPDDPNAETKLLITSNDSRIRVYNLRDKNLELKVKGHENSCSQIHATFSDDAQYIICGSEDCKAYIWSTGQPETEKDKRPMETFEAHSAIVTNAIMAPTKTRQLLSASGDPLYDLCNPPPVTLISRAQSQASSMLPTDDGKPADASFPPTPALSTTPATPFTPDLSKTTKPEESPAYLARCAHPDGNIIVTADYMGHIKVFRQDCAYQNRLRSNESAAFSKKMLGRTNSVATKHSNRSRRDSLQIGHPSSERILSWRQSITSTNGSLDNFRSNPQRSSSPRIPVANHRYPSLTNTKSNPSLAGNSQQPSPHRSSDEAKPNSSALSLQQKKDDTAYPKAVAPENPLMLQGEQSYMFWSPSAYQAQASASSHLGPNYNAAQHHLHNGHSQETSTVGSSNASVDGHHLGTSLQKESTFVSRLSSEEESVTTGSPEGGDAKEVICRECGGKSFKARTAGGKPILQCEGCGEAV